jgi:bifunctional non-homologous end joining protein LigD
MTPLLPELAGLPDGLAVDGELVAFGDDGLPSFPRLCDRMLRGKHRIEVILIIFDVLAIDGRAVHRRLYWERRRLLEDLALYGDYWSTTPSHQDGEALWKKVCALGLEGVVAKKRSGHYLPGRRGWIKTKNRAYWRYPLELAAALGRRALRPRSAVLGLCANGHRLLRATRCGSGCELSGRLDPSAQLLTHNVIGQAKAS